MFFTLKELSPIISGINAELTLIYINGKKRKTTCFNLTQLELNAKVLNIFAIDKDKYNIHLTKLRG